MLDMKNIRKTFNPGTVNEKTALNGVSLTLEDGDFVTVIGGNGAGKSTLLNAVAGVWPVDSTNFKRSSRFSWRVEVEMPGWPLMNSSASRSRSMTSLTRRSVSKSSSRADTEPGTVCK